MLLERLAGEGFAQLFQQGQTFPKVKSLSWKKKKSTRSCLALSTSEPCEQSKAVFIPAAQVQGVPSRVVLDTRVP